MEILASELRIGNWVKVFNIDFYKIHVISKTAIQVEGGIVGGEVFKLEHIQPIPLTPEIFERCGFERNRLLDSYELDKYSVRYSMMYYEGHEVSELNTCKYLHQLQNLYFALTNQELTYDSTK